MAAGAHGGGGPDEEKHAGYLWLFICVCGMVTSLTLYGIVLEYVTSGGRKLHELSFVFVTTSVYTITAYIARTIIGEKPTEISKYQMLTLSFTSMASTFTSVRSLRYVIYPVQVLFKSCKPVPVMAFGILLGKKYPLRKYVNVIIITTGVALFMGGGNSSKSSGSGSSETTLMGAMMLSVSLCFDGATGAYEDRLMGKDHVEPFDLMYNIQLGKAFLSFCCLVTTNGLGEFFRTLDQGGFMLIVLGLTGALGQIFVFVTISKFGALNCALIGLVRKMLSLILSFFLYGHQLNAAQTVGLALSIAAMIANFYEKGGKGKKKPVANPEGSEPLPEDQQGLLTAEAMESGEDGAPTDEASGEGKGSGAVEMQQRMKPQPAGAGPAAEVGSGTGADGTLSSATGVQGSVETVNLLDMEPEVASGAGAAGGVASS